VGRSPRLLGRRSSRKQEGTRVKEERRAGGAWGGENGRKTTDLAETGKTPVKNTGHFSNFLKKDFDICK
jgi:hypothetical protein